MFKVTQQGDILVRCRCRLGCTRWCVLDDWRNLANTIEPFMCGSSYAALCQITLTTCLPFYHHTCEADRLSDHVAVLKQIWVVWLQHCKTASCRVPQRNVKHRELLDMQCIALTCCPFLLPPRVHFRHTHTWTRASYLGTFCCVFSAFNMNSICWCPLQQTMWPWRPTGEAVPLISSAI